MFENHVNFEPMLPTFNDDTLNVENPHDEIERMKKILMEKND